MGHCITCHDNFARLDKARPYVAMRIDMLRVLGDVEALRDEVLHELSHRLSVGARRLAEALAERQRPRPQSVPVQPRAEDLNEKALRDAWSKNELYLERIDRTDGAADAIRQARAWKQQIEDEWVRRRSITPFTPHFWSSSEMSGDSSDLPLAGLLSAMGYRVASTLRRTEGQRRWFLDAIISSELPPVVSPEYLAGWGEPLTALRLEKTLRALRGLASMAEALPRLTACRDRWLEDAAYLEATWSAGTA